MVGAVALATLMMTGGCSGDDPKPDAAVDADTEKPANAADDVEPVDVAALEVQAKAAAGQVAARSRTFAPATVTIAPGQAVAWRFEDGQVPHGLASDSFKSSARTQGVVVHTFPNAGTYRYRCPIHPEMLGTVEVR